ncbi:MAG: sigma 54-interacting transcriptional regulator [Syntrophorhabdales bacterium]
MKVDELDLQNLLSFSPKGGVIQFMGHRVLLFDTVAMGLLRRELISSLGVSAARNILTRLGYAHGWLAADHLGSEFPDLLKDFRFGPAFLMLQGLVNVREFRCNFDDHPHHTICTFEDSYEAEQHILQFGVGEEPACWTLTGYVSGYSSRVAGRETYCIEHKCIGKGDALCSIESRLKEDWEGAIDDQLLFFEKESIGDVLNEVVTKLRRAERRLWQVRKFIESDIRAPGIVVRSKVMLDILDIAKRAAAVDSSVIITGESGAGKEKVARFIHNESPRVGRPFVAVNCSAVAEALLESEFFGHLKGSFTGADKDRIGLFEAANGGTIFLDEIAEMPQGMQAKLLRALQEKRIRRVGENNSRPVDVKIIAATNRNIEDDVKTGRFRKDLYYRLCVIELFVPPLRERTEDILPLARFFLDRSMKKMGRTVTGFSPDAAEHLLLYDWPGNIRELHNVVERAVALCSTSMIKAEDLPPALRKGALQSTGNDDIRPLDEIERKYILTVLEMTKGDKRLAAQKLNIGLASLYRRLKEYGLG